MLLTSAGASGSGSSTAVHRPKSYVSNNNTILYVTILLIIVFGVICYLPYIISEVLYLSGNGKNAWTDIIVTCILSTSMAMNVFLYGLSNSKFRGLFKASLMGQISRPGSPAVSVVPQDLRRRSSTFVSTVSTLPQIFPKPEPACL